MADVETFGLELYLGDDASPVAYTLIGGVTEIPQLFSYNRSIIDTTEIKDTVKSYLAGQLDPGEVNFTIKFDAEDPTHDESTGLISKMLARGRHKFCLKIPESTADGAAATYHYFDAIVTGLTPQGNQDDVIRASVTLKLSGLGSFSATAPTT